MPVESKPIVIWENDGTSPFVGFASNAVGWLTPGGVSGSLIATSTVANWMKIPLRTIEGRGPNRLKIYFASKVIDKGTLTTVTGANTGIAAFGVPVDDPDLYPPALDNIPANFTNATSYSKNLHLWYAADRAGALEALAYWGTTDVLAGDAGLLPTKTIADTDRHAWSFKLGERNSARISATVHNDVGDFEMVVSGLEAIWLAVSNYNTLGAVSTTTLLKAKLWAVPSFDVAASRY